MLFRENFSLALIQFLIQLEQDIQPVVQGNTGTLASFLKGAEDAGFLAKEFRPTFNTEDLINLPNFEMYLKLMVEGTPSKAFSVRTPLDGKKLGDISKKLIDSRKGICHPNRNYFRYNINT